jgi:hypothetical protein
LSIKDAVSGVRLTGQERLIAIRLGQGNISQGVRYALRFAAKEEAASAKLSTILRSAVRIAEALEQQRNSTPSP